ncbi:MAG: DUF2309 domain-containing protein [Saprospiraceae bacterium]
MENYKNVFSIRNVLHHLKHYLPSQAPLKDFIHHNTLHAFQDYNFFDALTRSSAIFGYKTRLSLAEFRQIYADGNISLATIDAILKQFKGDDQVDVWRKKMLTDQYKESFAGRRSHLRNNWKDLYLIDLDLAIQPFLFRFICSYLDQGIAIWPFPIHDQGFLETVRSMEKHSKVSIFSSARTKELLFDPHKTLDDLLYILVGDSKLYEHYLFDQQFSHPGWSGMIAVLEDQPESLLDRRNITLEEFIFFECLLEIDALDSKYGEVWMPLSMRLKAKVKPLFSNVEYSEYHEVLMLWQEAYEWHYYEQVLASIGFSNQNKIEHSPKKKKFQALFCIDDRECSIRRYVEKVEPECATYGTPGFFGVEFYYKPMYGKFSMKVCPAPVTPKYLIKELNTSIKKSKDFHFSGKTHGLLMGWLITHTIGFWSAIRLFINIFTPRLSPATTLSFRHMDEFSNLTIEYTGETEDGLQVGFNIEEMVDRVEGVLKSIGLIDDFADLIYPVGHGASSVNNTHYAGYDCGACSGRPGSVNARVFSYMANHPKVRALLKERGINIPDRTRFVGALHDTTRDEIAFYDEKEIPESIMPQHQVNKNTFNKALELNAFERSRRFMTTSSKGSHKTVHAKVKLRSVSLFEPRPELNHATNCLCIIGRRHLTGNVFLDRRAFLNSYDYTIDPDGKYLFNILKAAAPVCGGINLEYYFSRVDNLKLGAGTKLPHNVMGLIGVANGIDGDLRPGLPNQMVEVHDPLRLLIVVEHIPSVVADTIAKTDDLYQWFDKNWINLVVINPEDGQFYRFEDGGFKYYDNNTPVSIEKGIDSVIASTSENIPAYYLS